MVEPTNRNPSFFQSFEMRSESGVVAGTSPIVRQRFRIGRPST